MARGRKKKNPFDDLDDQFKDSMNAMTESEIRDRIAQIALNQEELMSARKEDQHLAELKEQVKEASAIYRDGTKMNKLRIAFARQRLADMGKV